MMKSSTNPMKKMKLYGRSFCPQVYTVRRELDRNGIEYEYIDIRQDASAAEQVREINNGYESVPTLVFSDGSTLTEPSTRELLRKLRKRDLSIEETPDVGLPQLLQQGPTLRTLAALFVLIGIFIDLQVLTWIGLALLATSFLLFFLRTRR